MGAWTKVRRSLGRGGMRGLVRDALSRIDVRPTAIPLEETIVRDIRASVGRAGSPSERAAGFPEIAELEALWPVVLLEARLLRDRNPGDRYFDDAQIRGHRAAGRRIEKNLFEIWLFLRWRPATILEIGTRTGMSLANKLAFAPTDRPPAVVCMDLFVEQGSPRIVRQNLAGLGVSGAEVHFLVGDSKQLVPALASAMPDLRFDYVLVDGSHDPDDAYADLTAVLPLVTPGGYVVFDDAGPTQPGVRGHDLIGVWERALAGHPEFTTKHYAVPHGFCVARRDRPSAA